MPVHRKAKGTAKAKASDTTLTLSNVTIRAGRTIVVGIVAKDYSSPGVPSVTWAGNTLESAITAGNYLGNVGTGMGLSVWKFRANTKQTGAVVATWSSAILARQMVVAAYDDYLNEDASFMVAKDATGAPIGASGGTSTTVADTVIGVGFFASNGPSSDTSGTLTTGGAGSLRYLGQDGQRDGTVGAPPISNVTLHEVYRFVDDADVELQIEKTGATSRDWICAVLSFERRIVTYEETDSVSLDELWADFLEAADLMRDNHDYTIALKDSGVLNITDFSDLFIEQTAPTT